VGELCGGVAISRSTYYAWCKRPPSQRAIEDAVILHDIERIYVETGEAYGSPRMFDDLVEMGYRIGRKRVERLMRLRELRARQFRHRRPKARGRASRLAPNLVRRQFHIDQLNTVWVADMTEFYTLEGKLYLAVVLDLCSRRVIGWATSDRPTARIVREAMCNALATRLPQSGLVHHSDQGSQYGSIEFQRILKRNGVRCSMSNRGTCADNSVMESFFSSLKRERTHGRRFVTREELRRVLFEYIEVFYNRRRRHSHIGGMSPAKFEESIK
jgi:putative transposase